MLDFLAHLWPWLVACLAIGAAAATFLHGGTLRSRPARWLSWFGAAFVAGVTAVAVGAVEGVVSTAIEIALACFAAFLLGAALAALRRGTLEDHERWAVGLLPVALLWWGAVEIGAPAYEAYVQKRIAALAQDAGVDPAGFGVSGRDVTAPSAVADKPALMAEIAATPGVRRVIVAQTAAPAAPETTPDRTATIAPPPPDSDPEPTPAALHAGELDATACQRALDETAASEPVAFRPARTTIDRRAALALDKAVEVIRRCPQATIEVRGHADAGASNEGLARRRALAAERYLRREGVAGRRLVAVGCCAGAQEPRRGSGAVDYILR
jgi:outer membrane protein OmpA-like peptidoglycan-associated protein